MTLIKYCSVLILLSFKALTLAQNNPCVAFQDYTIVVLGSSTAAGAGVSQSDSAWVNKYREYLKSINTNNEVINLAVGGYNTYRIMPTNFTPPANRPFPDINRNITEAIGLQPDAIIINMPSNDVAAGYSYQEQMFNLDTIKYIAGMNNIPVWICTTQPRNFSSVSDRQLQEDLKDSILQIYGSNSIDFWTTIGQPDNTINPTYNSGDGVHLNDAGHHILFQRVKNSSILDTIFEPDTLVDYSTLSISPLLENQCGDSLTEIEVIISAGQGLDTQYTTLNFEIENLLSGSTESDSIIFNNGLPVCTIDTVYFYANTYLKGIYKLNAAISNSSDVNNTNDSISNNFSTLGHPNIQVWDDTLCEPGYASLEVVAEAGDTVFWFENLSSSSIASGQLFTTPWLNTETTYYAESVRGNLYHSNELFTTQTSSINWNGTMFNLIPNQDIIVDSFDVKINTLGIQGVEIYYVQGSYLGNEMNSTVWILLGTSNVNVLSADEMTSVPIGNLPLTANDTFGIYIQMANPSSRLSYLNTGSEEIRSSPELTIITGSGINHNFSGTHHPRDWNGRVYYHFGERPEGECSTGRQLVTVLVDTLSFSIGNDTIIDIADSLVITAPENTDDHLWFNSETDSTITVYAQDLGPGIHHINVTFYDSLGCYKTSAFILGVATLASLNKNQISEAVVYPNPTRGLIYYDLEKVQSVTVFDMQGKQLISYQANSSNQLDISNLSAGYYIIRFNTETGIFQSMISKN